jgi:hypothetical protein
MHSATRGEQTTCPTLSVPLPGPNESNPTSMRCSYTRIPKKGLEIISIIRIRSFVGRPPRKKGDPKWMGLYEISYFGCLLNPDYVFRFCIKSTKNIVN